MRYSTQLNRFPVALPSTEEQVRIEARIASLQTRVEVEANHLAKLRQQKQGLMHDLLTARMGALLKQREDFKGATGFIVDQVMLRKIQLPDKVKNAIEAKLEAAQQSEQMQFVLEKERQEAERKRIEAKGVSDFQTIVSQSINANLLQWKGIEATETLAKSQNAKVVVIGAGRNGLPVILNMDKEK